MSHIEFQKREKRREMLFRAQVVACSLIYAVGMFMFIVTCFQLCEVAVIK